MRMLLKTVVIAAVIVIAALMFHQGSGRVLGWLKTLHGGAPHGQR